MFITTLVTGILGLLTIINMPPAVAFSLIGVSEFVALSYSILFVFAKRGPAASKNISSIFIMIPRVIKGTCLEPLRICPNQPKLSEIQPIRPDSNTSRDAHYSGRVVKHPGTNLPFLALESEKDTLDLIYNVLQGEAHKLECMKLNKNHREGYEIKCGIVIFLQKYEGDEEEHYKDHHRGRTISEAFQSIKQVLEQYEEPFIIDLESFNPLKRMPKSCIFLPVYTDITSFLQHLIKLRHKNFLAFRKGQDK